MYMIAEVSQYVAVASFAEAWIEIFQLRKGIFQIMVASFAEAWIEILSDILEGEVPQSRLLRGGVD